MSLDMFIEFALSAYLATLTVLIFRRLWRDRPRPRAWLQSGPFHAPQCYPDGAASPWEPPEPVTTGALRRLLAAPGDGAQMRVRYDGEGKWREN